MRNTATRLVVAAAVMSGTALGCLEPEDGIEDVSSSEQEIGLSLSGDRQRLIESWAARKGVPVCTAWANLSKGERYVFYTITHVLDVPGLSRNMPINDTYLNHVVELLSINGPDPSGSNGGMDFNRLYFTLDDQGMQWMRMDAHESDRWWWENSNDLKGPHDPFDESTMINWGGTTQYGPQTHFFNHNTSWALTRYVLADRGGMCSPPFTRNLVEMDIDYSWLGHPSNPLGIYGNELKFGWEMTKGYYDGYVYGGYSNNINTDWRPAGCSVGSYNPSEGYGLGCNWSPDQWSVGMYRSFCAQDSDCYYNDCNETHNICANPWTKSLGSSCIANYGYCEANAECCSGQCDVTKKMCKDASGYVTATKEIYGMISAYPSTGTGWDHMASANPMERAAWGYVAERWGYYTSTTPPNVWQNRQSYSFYHSNAADRHPIYRCQNGGFHALTRSSTCANVGGTSEGIIGYLKTNPESGHRALFLCRSGSSAPIDYFISPRSDCNGYPVVDNLGYYKMPPGCSINPNVSCGQNAVDNCGIARYTGDCTGGGGGCPEVEYQGQCYTYEETCYQCYMCYFCDPICYEYC